jgi:hypothetical protein
MTTITMTMMLQRKQHNHEDVLLVKRLVGATWSYDAK